MTKKLLSLVLTVSLLLFAMVPASLAKNNNKVKENYSEKNQSSNMDNTRYPNTETYRERHGQPQNNKPEKDTVSEDVYGSKNKGQHKGIANALLHVKNPLARTVLQAILDGESVSQAVYDFKNGLDSEIDPADIDTLTGEVNSLLEEDTSGDKLEKANTYKYMAQIQMRVGKNTQALKYMEKSVLNNPSDEETFNELSGLRAKLNDLSVKVYINGQCPNFDVPPRIQDGRTLVPVRFIAEGLDTTVSYDEATGTVTIDGSQLKIQMKINSRIALVNGREVELDVPATVENGRTMVPIRFIGEGFKCKVKYYGDSNLVSVTNQV
ncbi:MAG: copper amine oxidase N-terminal domain-containing protein [Bacillota bacterium]